MGFITPSTRRRTYTSPAAALPELSTKKQSAPTTSAHWMAHAGFADAVERFLQREGRGIDGYMEHLEARSPFRQGG